jgi:hypothetical protein
MAALRRIRYISIMKAISDLSADIMPSATPTEAELAAWEALPRDEQVRRLRACLTHPDATTPSNVTMSDILVRAHARLDAKQNNG